MRSTTFAAVGLAIIVSAACRPVSSPPAAHPEAEPRRTADSDASLGIPPGHLPPPGRCRVWMPGTPPGRQAKARSCSGIERDAPVGSWIVDRSASDHETVFVRVMDERRAGVVVRTRVYQMRGGKLVRRG
jgi:hypothetical protein